MRRLVPRVLPPTVGIRDMDVSDPGGALANVPAHDAPLGLEGALKAVTTQSTVWTPSTTRTRFVDRLKTLLNIPAALLEGDDADARGHAAALRTMARGAARRWRRVSRRRGFTS